MTAAYLQHHDRGWPRRPGQGGQEVEPGLTSLIQIGADPEHLARLHPGQGIAQGGIHDAGPRGLPQGLAGGVEEGRAIESPPRDELDQMCQLLCLFIGGSLRLGGRECPVAGVADDLAQILLPVAQPLGDAPALEIGDGLEACHLLVPGQADVLGDGHGGQGQNETV
ncbi:hypothetical protein D3C80_1101110 [compost metagenome]